MEKEKRYDDGEEREEKRRLMDAAPLQGVCFYFDYDSSSLTDDSRACHRCARSV
jgi:hypothetical protein